MLIVITGGSGSGKSAYAEEYLLGLAKENPRYYIATMKVYDKEGRQKIERHRRMRSGKGFVTIEQPVQIERALEQMKQDGSENALLECVSNLTANEMFLEEQIIEKQVVVDRVVAGIGQLTKQVGHLVIVTNNVFEDGCAYDEITTQYLKALGEINEKLAAMADHVIEVVVGIPIPVK